MISVSCQLAVRVRKGVSLFSFRRLFLFVQHAIRYGIGPGKVSTILCHRYVRCNLCNKSLITQTYLSTYSVDRPQGY